MGMGTEKKIVTTYIEYDENGKIKSKTITESPYGEPEECGSPCATEAENTKCSSTTSKIVEDSTDDEKIATTNKEAVHKFLEDEELPDDDDTKYIVTPKGLLCLAMLNTGFIDDAFDDGFDDCWRIFEESMKELGYIVEENND